MSALRTAKAPVIARRERHCNGCGCQLSRYNSEARCSACLRVGRDPSPALPCVPEHVWDTAEVQLALSERDFGKLCALVRRLGSLRQDDIATLTGLSQAFLSMLESGARKLTNIDKIVMLLEGLEVPTELTGPMLRMRRPLVEPDGARWHPRSDAEAV